MRTGTRTLIGLLLTTLALQAPGPRLRSLEAAEPAAASRRPNVILIIGDDHAWTDYGFMGNADVRTPHIDRLAAEGLTYTRGYVTTALCSPSLATLLTGLHPHQHGITGNDPVAGRDREEWLTRFFSHPMLPRLLADSGYLTLHTGKYWMRKPVDAGFTRDMGETDRHGGQALAIGRSTMQPIYDTIDAAGGDGKPFFVWYAPFLPHQPHNPPERLLQKYAQIQPPARAKYYAMIEWLDETVGSLMDRLRAKGVADDTLVVYLNDNGWNDFGKLTPYENGVRTPVVLRWPARVKPRMDREHLAGNIDVVPTILAAAGVPLPPGLPGVNLLDPQAVAARDTLYLANYTHNMVSAAEPGRSLISRTCIHGTWKLIDWEAAPPRVDARPDGYKRKHPPGPDEQGRRELFDLAADPGETKNLAVAEPARVRDLVARLDAWWKPPAAAAARRPNVLFIAIDDQNDWIGHLGGHPLAKTPHLDALAARGTTFTNAHCQAPLCNPSRTSLLVGLRPSTTGVYALLPSFRQVPALAERVTLPQHFATHGYRTAGDGKIFHTGTRSGGPKTVPGKPDTGSDFQEHGGHGGVGGMPPRKLVPSPPMVNHKLIDWGVWPPDGDDTTKGDWAVADWAADWIRKAPREEPFFLAAGFFLPHVPCYATQRWFDLFPDDDSVLPQVLRGDRDDTPHFSWYLHWTLPEPRLGRVESMGQWRNLVRSYLACTAFMDSQIGRLLAALEEAGRADETIVVVWSDHGWHLGEKAITGKNTLWERSTRVPLIFAGPGVTAGQRCGRPAELLDVYPTLVELCGLPTRDGLEGVSLGPQLRDAAAARERPAITTHNQGNHAVRSEHWRYIRYADGSEELYDLRSDPHEWKNLVANPAEAANPALAAVLGEHRTWLPRTDVPPVPGSGQRVLTYDKAADEAVWEGTTIRRADPIPQ